MGTEQLPNLLGVHSEDDADAGGSKSVPRHILCAASNLIEGLGLVPFGTGSLFCIGADIAMRP
jgi:hypothetical protein